MCNRGKLVKRGSKEHKGGYYSSGWDSGKIEGVGESF